MQELEWVGHAEGPTEWITEMCLQAQGHLLEASRLKVLADRPIGCGPQDELLRMATWNREIALHIIGAAAQLSSLPLDQPFLVV